MPADDRRRRPDVQELRGRGGGHRDASTTTSRSRATPPSSRSRRGCRRARSARPRCDFGLGRTYNARRSAPRSSHVPPGTDEVSRAAMMIGQDRIARRRSRWPASRRPSRTAAGARRACSTTTRTRQGRSSPASELSTLRDLMRQVVTRGTGSALGIAPGEVVRQDRHRRVRRGEPARHARLVHRLPRRPGDRGARRAGQERRRRSRRRSPRSSFRNSRLRSARRALRPSSWPRRAARSTSRTSAGRSTRRGRRARSPAKRARPRRPRSAARASWPCATSFFERDGARRNGLRRLLDDRLAALGRLLGLGALLAHPHVLRPPAHVGVQRLVLQRDRPRAHGVEQRAIVGDQQQRALEVLQRVLQRLAALQVQVVGGLVEDQDVGAAVHQNRQRQPLALATAQPVQRLLGVLAGEQELPQQRPRVVRRQLRGALAGPPAPSVPARANRRAAPTARASRCARSAACRRRTRARRSAR